jgi:hypothetical protein
MTLIHLNPVESLAPCFVRRLVPSIAIQSLLHIGVRSISHFLNAGERHLTVLPPSSPQDKQKSMFLNSLRTSGIDPTSTQGLSHSLSRYMGPPSRWQMREGGCPPFFHGSAPAAPFCSRTRSGLPQPLGSFFFSFPLSFADRFFLFHSHPLPLAPSSRVALVASPPCHASPLRRTLPLITPLSHPPITTRRPFAMRCLRPRCAAPRHASPLSRHAFVTRRPSRVASPRCDARFGLAVSCHSRALLPCAPFSPHPASSCIAPVVPPCHVALAPSGVMRRNGGEGLMWSSRWVGGQVGRWAGGDSRNSIRCNLVVDIHTK